MFQYETLTSEISRKVQCRSYPEYVKIKTSDGNQSCVLVKSYTYDAERIKNFTVYEDDTWVITFPKTGSTWTQIMVWLIANDLDYETVKNRPHNERFPFIEFTSMMGRDFPSNSLSKTENMPRPRFIQSHLPKFLLPDQLWTKKPKIIYVTRNPKDTAISYFHHYRHIQGYFGSKEDFFDAFMQDNVAWAPFIPHVLEFWQMKNEKNVFYANYEDMQENLRSIVVQMTEFCGKTYNSAQIDELVAFLSVDSMRSHRFTSHEDLVTRCKVLNENFIKENNLKADYSQSEDFQFIRKGEARAYETEMSPEWNEKFDKWIETSLQGTDLKFKL